MNMLKQCIAAVCAMVLCSTTYAQISKVYTVGDASGFVKSIKAGNKNQSSSKDLLDLPLGNGKFLKGKKMMNTKLGTDSLVIGNIEGEPISLFKLYYTESAVRGVILLTDKKQAYEFFTEAGVTKVKEIDIHTKVCVKYGTLGMKAQVISGAVVAAAPPAGDPVYNLQSLAGAACVVKLDFDGQYVTGTDWNVNFTNGQPIDAQPSNFTVDQIRQIWEGVAEDFRPFNINITTSETVYQNASSTSRMRTIFTPTNFYPPWLGVAYPNSFVNEGGDLAPCWVWSTDIGFTITAGSHEVGHTLGLEHDGGSIYGDYYNGNGSWGPIMGNPSIGTIQWSQGEYKHANNAENDLSIITTAIITASNGLGYRTDEDQNTTATARTIAVDAAGTVNPLSTGGIISTRTDKDFFKIIVTDQTSLNLLISPLVPRADFTVTSNPNLNISVRLLNNSGTALKTYSPTNTLSVQLDKVSVGAGTYFLEIDGVGEGAPATGYSDYGSLGGYSISGTISGCKNNHEPNASTAAAIAIPLNSTLNASITSSTDNDYYKLTINNLWDINVSLMDVGVNLEMQLLNSAGTVVASSTNTGSASEHISYLVPSTGTYFVRVYGNAGVVSTSCYTLSNTLQQNGCITEVTGGNNSVSTATTFPIRTSIQGAINTTTDQDYYMLTIAQASTLTLKLSDVFVDLDMQLVNASGTQLSISQLTGQSEENMTYNVTTAGTYYVRIFGKSGANIRRCYTLTNNLVFPCDNAYEPNSVMQLSKLIGLNTTIKSDLVDEFDQDYYDISVSSEGKLTLTLSNLPVSSFLRLYNSNKTILAENNNLGTATKTMTLIITEEGTYTIGVGTLTSTVPAPTCYSLANSFATCTSRSNITGGSTFCPYETEVPFSIPATTGSTYQWNPFGLTTIVAGRTSNAVKINMNGTYSGTYPIKVYESTSTGCFVSSKSITVRDQTNGTCSTNYPKKFELTFTASGEKVTIPHNPIFNIGTGDFTIEVRGKFDDRAYFLNTTTAGYTTGIEFRLEYDGYYFSLLIVLNGAIYQSEDLPYSYAITACKHFAVKRSNGTVSFQYEFSNLPIRLGTDSYSNHNINTTNNLIIGNNFNYSGTLYDFRIWKNARTTEEIGAYQNAYVLQTRPENKDLVGYWTFHESGQKVYDGSLFNNHGYLGSNATQADAQDPIRNVNGAVSYCYDSQMRQSSENDGATFESIDQSVSVVFYPNPFELSGELKIQGNTGHNFTVQVLDLDGRVMLETVLGGNQSYTLPESLKSGMYFIKVNGSDFDKTLKVVKYGR